ncbi:Threonine aldolase [Pichia californica]|uniref:low-specificity L-threonine aldolase n=1 Tax=Pichia californica TaxID=460514 RepID=A0A9P6WFV8_9ASCO|nr:Threonine aldolase [[Candida] californica]
MSYPETPLPENHNEFRSDTFTTPTESMIRSVGFASVSDSVYNEDADTKALEKKVADIMGYEAGLYCVSGTLSNQIALRSHLKQPPHSIICDYRGHVYVHEAGGLATLSQAMVTDIKPSNGLYLTLEDIVERYTPDDGNIHAAPTKVVSLENTLHGLVYPIEEIKRISNWCHANGLLIHLDGARIWDASIASGVPFKEYGKYFDSISVCLSKGVGAPIGSVLVGSETFIKKANHFKKQNGGGIRQCGMLCRMASIAIDENFPKMKQAHLLAKEVADYCEDLGLILEIPCQSNFIFLDPLKNNINPSLLSVIGEKYNIKMSMFRLSFSFQTSRVAVDNLKLALKELKETAENNPYYSKKAFGMYQSGNREE